jgi:hypothetical protein
MQQISSFDAAFRWTPPRLPVRKWWIASAAIVLAVVLGWGFGVDQRTGPTPAAAAVPAAKIPVPYVSSDPSVPPADTVTFPDPQPHIEAF